MTAERGPQLRGSRNDARPSRPSTTRRRRGTTTIPTRRRRTPPSFGGCSRRVRPAAPCSMLRAARARISSSSGRPAGTWSGSTSQPACSRRPGPRRSLRALEHVGLQELDVRRRVRWRDDHRCHGERPARGLAGRPGEPPSGDPPRRPPLPDGRGGGRRRDRRGVRRGDHGQACRPCTARSSRATPPATTSTRHPSRSRPGLDAEGLDVVDEGYDQEDGWGYRHLLLRSRAGSLRGEPGSCLKAYSSLVGACGHRARSWSPLPVIPAKAAGA